MYGHFSRHVNTGSLRDMSVQTPRQEFTSPLSYCYLWKGGVAEKMAMTSDLSNSSMLSERIILNFPSSFSMEKSQVKKFSQL